LEWVFNGRTSQPLSTASEVGKRTRENTEIHKWDDTNATTSNPISLNNGWEKIGGGEKLGNKANEVRSGLSLGFF